MRAVTHPVRFARARTRTLVDRLLHHAEIRRGRRLPERSSYAPIFVIGPPRSGSTLFFQLLVEAFDAGWLANAHMRWPGGASRIERRERPRAARSQSHYTSRYGDTDEPWEPHEGTNYWYRFFPRDRHEMTDADATPQQLDTFRAAIRELADACGGPVFFKNSLNTLRLPVIATALPEARFIYISRDREANARSILTGRIKNVGIDHWWSARPAGAEQLAGDTPAAQVVWQSDRINHIAQRELTRLAEGRWLHITYEDLCAFPAATIDRIDTWLRSTGVSIERRSDAVIPDSFDVSSGRPFDPPLEAEFQAALATARSSDD
ncbi:MAG: hypothetical protein JWN41_1686 [Thermoleophilia bacterium]|nr:hypothetical protein [Thermoleophilia bacterium]